MVCYLMFRPSRTRTDPTQATTSAESKKRLALAIIDFLSTSLKDGTLGSDSTESVEVAQSCIADAFNVDPSDKKAMQDAIGAQSLLSIYSVYEKLKGKSTASTTGASSANEARPSTPSVPKPDGAKPSPRAPNPEAEALKSKGNGAMASKDYKTAIDLYTKAVDLDPLNPIFLSNRAAAHSALGQHADAVGDAELAVAADPTYTKAWSRLGLARFALRDARGSMEAYAKGIEYEGRGGSDAMKKGYETAKRKVDEEARAAPGGGADDVVDMDADEPAAARAASPGAGGAGAGGMPDLASLAGMFGGGGGGAGRGGGGGGGGPDLSSLMNNPMFASMAQNVMSNPEMMGNIMNNPRLREMAQNFGGGGGGGGAGGGAGGESGGGGGGMPDLSSLMQDPSLAEM